MHAQVPALRARTHMARSAKKKTMVIAICDCTTQVKLLSDKVPINRHENFSCIGVGNPVLRKHIGRKEY